MKYNVEGLKNFLEEKALHYNSPDFIDSDPISIPHRFTTKEDIEISAFLTSVIAWGNRKSIIASSTRFMQMMDNSPHQFVLHHTVADLEPLKTFVHRTFNGSDTVYFVRAMKKIFLRHNGLSGLFEKILSENNNSIPITLHHIKNIFYSLPHPRTTKHLPDPLRNSSSKRINMFLRWMVRKDNRGVDFGLWNFIHPSQLFIPLDVHSGNTARKLGLLHRKQNDWKAVEELTSALRLFDSQDPVKYDFALFGLGVFEKF
jgi:uncharacterized protein (TIGR02757 family)